MQNVCLPRLVAGRCLLQALLALSVFIAALEVSAQTPAPKYRRVDLGRGMWRVEPVLDSSVVPYPPAKPARTDAPDAEVARHMLAEARRWASVGQFDRARQLIEWASTLDVDWEAQPATPAGLMNELRIIELRLQPPQSPSGSDDFHSDSLFRPESRSPELHVHVQGVEPRTDSNDLRMAADPASRRLPGAASGTMKIDSIEDTATTFAGASSSTDTSGQHVSNQPGDQSTSKELTASSPTVADSEGTTGQDIPQPTAVLDDALSGWNSAGPAAGGGATMPPETRGFWRGLAVSALCGLVVMVLFAFLMLRRVMLQQRDILQAMVETSVQRSDPAAEAGHPTTVHSALVPAEGPVQTPRSLRDQPIGWTAPDTFHDQKKRADDRRREQDTELMRQLISSNVSIRKRVSDKRTAAA